MKNKRKYQITTYLEESTFYSIEELANKEGRTLADIVRRLLIKALKEN